MKKLVLALLSLVMLAALVFSACSAAPPSPPSSPGRPQSYSSPAPAPGVAPGKVSSGPDTIGFAVGGAKDIQNFRENIKNNYLPLPTDVSYEGLFYDYYFDTGASEVASGKLYYPSYSYAVTRDPISSKTDYYLSVGLNSGMKESDFRRKKLNLVIVLDNSGSMSEQFNRYYYDRFGKPRDAQTEGGAAARKIDSARLSVAAILDQLRADDRFAVVLFNSNAFLLQSMGQVGQVNMKAARSKVMEIVAGGSTNMEAGIEMGTAQFRGLREVNSQEFENRIIFLTDAQPNTGDFSARGLLGMAKSNAENRIYTTFIGIGVDFNTQLVDQITRIKGANYYSIHSAADFRERVEEEFEYMVTPLVFDLRLNFDSRGWKIEKVFGSPEADEATGELMKVNTLFPSRKEHGETRGGLVLLKLRKTSSTPEKVTLKVSYEDRNGRADRAEASISLETEQPEFFGNNGIRKGVLLTRYAALLKNWMIDERQNARSRSWEASVGSDRGIPIPGANFSQWERQSVALVVSESYRSLFKDFARYFDQEMRAIGDNALGQELKILDSLAGRW
ncbi:MAG: VWA domain-containing protein [Chloroflexi bacterium]|nr:VWA domain-containing protein [Chloroflexota bacterium]